MGDSRSDWRRTDAVSAYSAYGRDCSVENEWCVWLLWRKQNYGIRVVLLGNNGCDINCVAVSRAGKIHAQQSQLD